jgi:peptide chain release factor 3
MRKLPVMTFVNKMDRPGRDPIDLMDEVGKTLKIRTVAAELADRRRSEFKGVLDRRTREVVPVRRESQGGTEIAPKSG